MPDTDRPADAVRAPEAIKRGATQLDRIDSILAVAEPLLGVDRSRGERGYIRKQPGSTLFVTKDPLDTLQFPNGHPRSGQPRYRWACGDDGIDLGYLVP